MLSNTNSTNNALARRGRSRDVTRAPVHSSTPEMAPPDELPSSRTFVGTTQNVVVQNNTCPDSALRPEVANAFERTEAAFEATRAACGTQARAAAEACGAQARAADEACAARDQSMKDILGPFLEGLQAEMRQGLQALGGRLTDLENRPSGASGSGGGGAPPPSAPRAHDSAAPEPRPVRMPWDGSSELVQAVPVLAMPMDLESWQRQLGMPGLNAMASAFVAEQEARVVSHSLRLASTAALNAFLLTHNTCLAEGMGRAQLRVITEPSLRVFLALAKTLQVYLAPRQRRVPAPGVRRHPWPAGRDACGHRRSGAVRHGPRGHRC